MPHRTTILVLGLTLSLAACATTGAGDRAARPDRPGITYMSVKVADPTRKADWMLGEDTALLRVTVRNPESVHLDGVVACRYEGAETDRPIEQRVSVGPGTMEEVIVPLVPLADRRKRLSCQLRYGAGASAPGSSSPWTEVTVPARGRS